MSYFRFNTTYRKVSGRIRPGSTVEIEGEVTEEWGVSTRKM